MIKLSGYKITELIYTGENSSCYRGIRNLDNTHVIIKILNKEYPSLKELENFKTEYKLTKQSAGDKVIQVYSIENYKNTIALILEDFGANSLSEYMNIKKLTFNEKLLLAINIAKAIHFVHKKGIIHKDLNPSNIVLNFDTGELKIIDFGISTELSNEKQHYMNDIEGTCLYISPEQTGKVHRMIDQRSDLYSIGVIYYELFTGIRPFVGDDLDVIYKHIAKVPAAPNTFNSEVPKIISDIIMKLLSKNAEDRYQTAAGLESDLEYCYNNLSVRTNTKNFKIAQNDVPNNFQIPQKLYGRYDELKKLKDFIKIADNIRVKLVLIAGHTGIGKTSLVQEIVNDVVNIKWRFISGKYEQFESNIPYSAIIYAIKMLITKLITDEKDLNLWKNKITKTLGINAKLITDFIPDLEQIIGKQPDVINLNPNEEKNRFYKVFRDFVNVFLTKERPLILFLDDVQWCDLSSIDLMKYLLLSVEIKNLVVILSYRDNEMTKKHPLMFVIEESTKLIGHTNFLRQFNLSSLNEEAINKLISDTLKCNIAQTKQITTYIYQKTKGNPFFTNQLLKSMYEKNVFRFNDETRLWEWDITEIENAQISDNVVGLLIQNLNLLSNNVLDVLKLASCIGTIFDLQTLYLLDNDIENTSSALWMSIEKEYIVPLDRSYRLILSINKENYNQSDLDIKFKFSHDRIQYAVNSIIPENELISIHYKIGKILLNYYKKTESVSNIFELTNHLNKSLSIIKNKDERLEILDLNIIAGKKAKSNTAYDTAKNYFGIARDLLTAAEWLEFPDKLFDLSFDYAEAVFLFGEINDALILCDNLLKLATDNIKIARICLLKTTIHDLQGVKRELMVDNLIEVLKLFDVVIPNEQEKIKKQAYEKLMKIQAILVKKSPEQLVKELPIMTDQDKIIAMNLLYQALSPAFQSNSAIYGLIQVTMFEMSLCWGVTDVSCKNFVEFGITQGAIFKNYDLAYQFGQVAFTLIERLKAYNMKSASYFIFANFISHWKVHYSESIDYFNLAIRSGLENGDILHATYAAANKLYRLIYIGKNLNECKIEIEQTAKFFKDYNAVMLLELLDFFSYFINQMQLPYNFEAENSFLEATTASGNITALLFFGQFNVIINYILANFAAAEKWCDFIEPYLDTTTEFFIFGDHFMFQSLLLIRKFDSTSDDNKNILMEKINTNLEKLKLWAENCPENFAHKYYIASAELARIKNRPTDVVLDLYKNSLDSIRPGEFTNLRAVINEIVGEFWLTKNNDIVGKAYIKEAYYFYDQWGASAKLDLLNSKYGHFFKQISDIYSNQLHSFTSTSVNLDLKSIIKASNAISKEIKLDRLLLVLMETVIENAGAQNGFIILKNIFDDIFYIEAAKYAEIDEIQIMNSIPINEYDDICKEIIQSVIRTKDYIIIGDALKDEYYKFNKYIKEKKVKSILCAPIIYQNNLKGIIYLENNITGDLFNKNKLDVINMLSSQISISIEKAQLSQSLEKIKATQEQMVQSEKMASLGNLVAGVAHEINTPLGVSLTAVTHMISATKNITQVFNNNKISKFDFKNYLNDSLATAELLLMNITKATNLIKGFKRVSVDMSTEDARTFNFKKYIEDILISLSPKLKKYKHNIKITCDNNIVILSYPGVFSQIFTNLIINSLIHAYDENDTGKIEIKIFREEDNLKIIYSDDGKGMDLETKSKIFEPFFTTNRQNGTGLGLHIIFNLVTHSLKGTIKCESKLHEGTQFIINIKVD